MTALAIPSRPRAVAPPDAAAPARMSKINFEIFENFAAASADWRELAQSASASAFQSPDFLAAWHEAEGAAQGVAPMILLARDDDGRPALLLPLGRRRRSGLWIASFLGAKHSNYNLPLVRRDVEVAASDLRDALRDIGRRAATRVDLYALKNQPSHWRGRANPLVRAQDLFSPSHGYATQLSGDYAVWRRAHYSAPALKKMRRKAENLALLGPLRHEIAHDEASRNEILAAFKSQHADRLRLLGARGALHELPNADFLARVAARCVGGEGAQLELHALRCGQRIVAAFAGLFAAGSLQGMVISYEVVDEIARCSPGVLLIGGIVENLYLRGAASLDLGVGEARYKFEACETRTQLFDAAIGVSVFGRLAAQGFLNWQRLKRAIKGSPSLMSAARQLRAATKRLQR